MESKSEESHKENESSVIAENGEENGTALTKEDEVTESLENEGKKPEETDSELPPSTTSVEVAQEPPVEEEDSKRKDSELAESAKFSFSQGIPKRYALLFLVFLGFVNIYGLRINLNVALVAMVNNRTYTRGGVTVKEPAEFHWNSKTQGKSWSVYAWGWFFSGMTCTSLFSRYCFRFIFLRLLGLANPWRVDRDEIRRNPCVWIRSSAFCSPHASHARGHEISRRSFDWSESAWRTFSGESGLGRGQYRGYRQRALTICLPRAWAIRVITLYGASGRRYLNEVRLWLRLLLVRSTGIWVRSACIWAFDFEPLFLS